MLYLLSGRNPTRTVPITSHERPMMAKVILQEHKSGLLNKHNKTVHSRRPEENQIHCQVVLLTSEVKLAEESLCLIRIQPFWSDNI